MIIILLVLSLIPLATTWFSGQPVVNGIPFWGPHGHDSIWHLSLISQLQNHFPPQNPIFSGTLLSNYHYGFDMLLALLTKFTPFSISLLYFRLIPLIFTLSVTLLSYLVGLKLSGRKLVGFYFAILNLFAGSAGFIVELFRSGQLGGESLFWSMQSISFLINPPYALSLIICLTAILILVRPTSPKLLIVGIFLGILPIIKIYGFFFLALILAAYLFLNYKDGVGPFIKKYYLFFTASFIVTSFVFIFFGLYKSGTLLTLQPLWFTHSLIEAQDKLFIPTLASWRYNVAASPTLLKLPFLVLVELLLILVFYFGNFFFRLLGLAPSNLKNLNTLEKSILISSLVCALIPLFFIQKGTPWNTIQFIYYSLIGANYFFAKYLIRLRLIPVILILVFTCLTTLGTLKDYFGFPSPSILPVAEIKALNYLSVLPGNTVFTVPYDPYAKTGLSTPIPLRFYETTAYVAAYSGKQTYISDSMNAEILGLPVSKRLAQSLEFLNSDSRFAARGFLLNNQIDYIYLAPNQSLSLSASDLEITEIYSQEGIRIYQVQK
jgi:hypothetical protein